MHKENNLKNNYKKIKMKWKHLYNKKYSWIIIIIYKKKIKYKRKILETVKELL